MTNIKHILFILILLGSVTTAYSEVICDSTNSKEKESVDSLKGTFTFGGYGEVTLSRHFYSSAWQRYSMPTLYKNSKGYGRADMPHLVFMIGYNFGKGWSFGSEIELEHGGVGASIEIEEEETGEYESEVEKGGEIILEQFWINKSWNRAINLKMGHIVVPVGMTNQYHLPNQYFGVFRPEGDATILPCAWHETGLSFWGEDNGWDYEVMVVTGLDADRFSPKNWIGSGSGTPYEFKIASNYAGAFRVGFNRIKHLSLDISGYCGTSAKNTLNDYGYGKLNGLVSIGSFDFRYITKDLILRGGVTYGHLGDSYDITIGNAGATNNSPTPGKAAVASDAISSSMELGYNFFGLSRNLTENDQKFYLFARAEYYNSMLNTAAGVPLYKYQEKINYSIGCNYSPLDELMIKAEYQYRDLVDPQYNDEPTISIGITWTGLFINKKI